MALFFRVAMALALVVPLSFGTGLMAQAAEKLRFAVGPFQPTPSDTRKAFEPFFAHIADSLGRDYELAVTNDWAGIAIALANGQSDVAWMGPWGYVLAHHEGGVEAIATVKYQDRPFYYSIMVAQADAPITDFPGDAKGKRLTLADVGSTSGWLIPTHFFLTQNIDPKKYFAYRDGASHAAQVISVISGQTDIASDYDRNLDGLVARGAVKEEDIKIIWQSEPLPNDPLVVRQGFDAALTEQIREIVLAIGPEEAETLMPPNYTGWVAATHASYKAIEDAGIAVGRIDAPTTSQ